MAQQNLTRKNHYVAQLYLGNFADTTNKIQTYRLLVHHEKSHLWQPNYSSEIGFQEHLYNYLTETGLNGRLEQWFKDEFEDPAVKPLQKVLTHQKLKPVDWQCLIRFAASLDVRSPARMMDFYHRSVQTVPDLLKEVGEKSKNEISSMTPEEKKLLDSPPGERPFPLKVTPIIKDNESEMTIKLEAFVGRKLWLDTIEHQLTSTFKVLLDHRWTILQPAKGFVWFTTDQPVLRLNLYTNGTYDLKGGWNRPKGNLLLPLSPQHLMVTEIGAQRAPWRNAVCSVDTTKFIRKLIAQNAHRSIFSSRPEDELLQIRPREVNTQKCEAVKEYWKKWHIDNVASEQELLR